MSKTCGKCGSTIADPGQCPICNDQPFGSTSTLDYVQSRIRISEIKSQIKKLQEELESEERSISEARCKLLLDEYGVEVVCPSCEGNGEIGPADPLDASDMCDLCGGRGWLWAISYKASRNYAGLFDDLMDLSELS